MEEDYIEPSQPSSENELEDSLIRVSGMYKDWFLDYASYVILERAVPSIEDGFKPVQRRILHSMKDLDDGRFNKVANIVGHTMQGCLLLISLSKKFTVFTLSLFSSFVFK